MTTTTKIIAGALLVISLGGSGYILTNNSDSSRQKQMDTPEKIVADQEDLLARAEQIRTFMGDTCDNKKDVNKKIDALEKEMADLAERKKQWLDDVPKLPDIDMKDIETENKGRPGTEVPELSSDAPPLPDIDPIDLGAPGSQVPDNISPTYPTLPDIDSEFIPEMPELNTGRPGTEVPELSTDAPTLPKLDFVDPDEYIYKMAENEQKILDMLAILKDMCQEDDKQPVKKVISDKCTDACERHKDCAAYTEDVTPADLNDAYNSCMEECPTWPKNMAKCINATDIKTPNDCVSLVQCQLPQFYTEKYGQ